MEALFLEFARPLALALLALPIALLLFARLVDRPPASFTGAFELWLAVASARPDDARARRKRIPPPLWIFALGLACAVLAAAGPRPREAAGVWRVLVDRSPSMYLPVSTEPGAPTRLARAAELLRERLSGVELDWADVGADLPVVEHGGALPETWSAPPRFVRRELEWSAHDAAGTVWLTDASAGAAPARATLCTGGGDAVPGLVGRRGELGLVWDGVAIREEAVQSRRGYVLIESERFYPQGPPLDALRAWTDARSLLMSFSSERQGLLFARAGGESVPRHEVHFGRDGWRAIGVVDQVAPREDADGPLSIWLAADDGTPVVTAGPGRVYFAAANRREFVLESGDEAVAVSFARLFDECVQPAPGVVALAERAAAGEPRFVFGPPPEPKSEALAAAARWTSASIALALFLVLGAVGWTVAAARAGG